MFCSSWSWFAEFFSTNIQSSRKPHSHQRDVWHSLLWQSMVSVSYECCALVVSYSKRESSSSHSCLNHSAFFSLHPQGACVLHMLRHFLSDDMFQRGIVRYLRKYSYRNALNQDLWDSLANVWTRSHAMHIMCFFMQFLCRKVTLPSNTSVSADDIQITYTTQQQAGCSMWWIIHLQLVKSLWMLIFPKYTNEPEAHSVLEVEQPHSKAKILQYDIINSHVRYMCFAEA